MRTTTLSLLILTLGLGLAGCGGAGGLGDGYYIGHEDGQHFGDNSWDNDEFWALKSERFASFPFSQHGPVVFAGPLEVAFEKSTGAMVVDGAPLPHVTLQPTGEVVQDGQILGSLMYVLADADTVGVALRAPSGNELHLVITDLQTTLVDGMLALEPAPVDRAPRSESGLPLAQPAA